MSYTLLSETFPVARKQHRCIWCGEAILPGEKYRDERSIFDGSFQHHKWHPECSGAQQDEYDADYGGEFEAHQNERPSASGVKGPEHG